MPGLDHAVIRRKLEALRLDIQAGPSKETDAREQLVWLEDKVTRLIEILLYLGS